MDDEQIRDEAMTLFFAGHETTAAARTWTWFLLANHPDVEARLQEELDAVLGERTPSVEDLGSLTYTEMVVSEAIRLYPPAWLIGRRALADFEAAPYVIPAGVIVILSPYVSHRDPRWFSDPARFDPERWTGPARAAAPGGATSRSAAARVCASASASRGRRRSSCSRRWLDGGGLAASWATKSSCTHV